MTRALWVGVVGLMWATRQSFSEDRATEITATVQRVAYLLLRGTSDEVPDGGVLHALLSVNQDPWLLLAAVAGPDEVTRDFVVQAASPLVEGAGAWIGRRVMDIWPPIAADGMGGALTRWPKRAAAGR
jgi:hypothetical protein